MSQAVAPFVPTPLPNGPAELNDQLVETAEIIRQHERFAVAAHAGPDGDAIGSTLAMGHLLTSLRKDVVLFNRDRVPYTFEWLPGAERITQNLKFIPKDTEVFFVLDCSSLERVHNDLKIDRSRTKVVVIDHHATIDSHAADLLVHDVTAAAVGEMLYRLVVEMQLPLTQDLATCLFTSIQTDTGSFKYSNTRPSALMAAAQLVEAGVDVWEVTSALHENHPVGRVRLLGEVLDTLQLSICGRLAFLTVTKDMYRRTGTGPEMLDGFINHARGIRGVEAAAQLREVGDNEFRVSFRSRGRVDVAEAAAHFGGGGHKNAAGCTVHGTAEQVTMEITAVLQRLLGSE